MYTSPLGDIVREHGLSFHFYADDSQLYTSFAFNDTSDLVAATQRLENCVADINLWMTANKLKAHVHPRCIARPVLQKKTFRVVENRCL